MTFLSERSIKAVRKAQHCESCGKEIAVGSSANYWTGKFEGEFYTCYFHLDCREAEIAFNRHVGAGWDEWISLHTIDDEDDWFWLQENYPAILARIRGEAK
jgi:hypothetical protein